MAFSIALSDAEVTGLFSRGSQKRSEPVGARGTITTEKLLDAGELAAQISDIIADIVMSKLADISLTAENIEKLNKLGDMPPADTVHQGMQEASLADAALSELAAIGLTEKNNKKLATLGGGASSLSPIFYLSSSASNLPGHILENHLVENIQHCDLDKNCILRRNIRNAIQELLKNPAVCKKSMSQMEAILLIM